MHLEKHQCVPYIIQQEERCGRMLMAGRDIQAGEVIFTDIPGAVGPDLNSKPCCLSCYKKLEGDDDQEEEEDENDDKIYRCSQCSWPLCSPTCEDGPHARECQLFQIHRQHRPNFIIDNNSSAYNAIMVLRVLWLKEQDPGTWEKINILMDHNEAKESTSKTKHPSPEVSREDILDFIRNHCKLTQFSQQEILHVLGVIDTNTYIVGENPDKDVDLQGIFPIASILNHSCTSNTIQYALDDFRYVCRAVTDIRQGEELTTNYFHFRYHFFGLTYRITELYSLWHFQCSCHRCHDVTEFGTHCDSIQCKNCSKGFLSSINCLHQDSDWVCDTCSNNITNNDIKDLINDWWNVVEDTPKYDVRLLEELLNKLLDVFHPNHYYPMEVKRKIIENIGETEGFEMEELSVAWLQKKVDYCRDHLEIQSLVAPGLSEYQAYMSWHISKPLYWLASKKHEMGDMEKTDLNQVMCQVAEHLLMVINIWGPYVKDSLEQSRAAEALELLGKVDDAHLHQHLVTKAEQLLEKFIEEPCGRGHMKISVDRVQL